MKFNNFNFSEKQKNYLNSIIKIGVFLLVLMIGFSFYMDHKIKEKISEIVGLECKKIDVSILLRKADLNYISYTWSDSKFDNSTISCKTVKLNGIKWWSLIIHNQLKISELHISNIDGKIDENSKAENTPYSKEENIPLLNSIFINNIFLEKLNIKYNKQRYFHIQFADLYLNLNQFKYDLNQPYKAIKYEGFNYSSKKGSWTPENGKYAVHCNSINGNMKDNFFAATGIKLQPLQDEKKFELNTPNVMAKGIDYKNLLNGKGLDMENLTVEDLALKVHVEKSKNPCDDCYKPFIHERLLKWNFPITVDKVELKNNRIDIEVLNENKEKVAKVNFDKIYASIYNLTNEKEKISDNPIITADVNTMFMEQEELDVKLNFNLNDKLNGYLVKASIKDIDLVTMNDIFKHAIKANIKSGRLKQLNFNIDGNQEVATGTMSCKYENLEIEMLNESKLKPRKFFSKIVNKLGIKKDNSIKTGNFAEGKIHYARNKNKGIFHQWWGAIQSGFQSTIMPNILLPDELEN